MQSKIKIVWNIQNKMYFWGEREANIPLIMIFYLLNYFTFNITGILLSIVASLH